MARTDEINVISLMEQVPDEASAYRFLEGMRWGDEPYCPHCGNDERIYFLNPENGVSRKTRTGSASQRRVWKCGACRKQFSVLTGTIFHGTKIAVRKWLFVIFEMCASKNGVSAREVERKYNLSPKSAWFMLHRIREAMKREPLAGMLSGTVVVDETWVGGSERNKHKSPKAKGYGAGARAHWKPKTPVMSVIDTATGEARSKIIPDVTGATLSKAMSELGVNKAETTLHTDGHKGYRNIAHEFAAHEWVDHEAGIYVRDGVTSNHAENFFSQLKRSLDGTHHHVSREHLERYLAEFDFRYSTRDMSDTARMRTMVERVAGRRLSYRPLTGG